MINNRDCFFYKKSDFINRLQDLSPDSVCYIADTQQIYTHGRYFECNVTQDIVEQLIQNHGYLTPADLPVLTGGASPTPDEYVTGVSVGGHNINVQKGKLSEINVGSASKLETPRKIELSGDLSGSIMFDGSQDVNIETIVHNSTTADRLTTPRTISLSSQATGQVSFDGSGNVDIPVTINELDSKNANNRDLNSLVTLNGYGGNLFYGIGGNTSTNRPSGVDWFGLFSFKSASGNYTTQILGSNNRLYSRSNADTSLGSWNTIAYLTDNVASATKLQNTRTFTISDGTNSGTASNFDGTGNVTLRLPRTINANIIGNVTGDIVGDITGDLHGNADTATKLQTGRNINGTLFDGTKNIITAQWGTARNLTIGNSTKSVNGSANVSWTLSEIGAVNKAGDTMTGTLNMQAGINLAEADGESWHLRGIFATNDWWDIAGYSTAKDDGYLDIRTGDNGDEGIRVSQWDSSKLVREAWLLNSHGNTIFPGIVVAPTFSGALSGNASTASRLATARTISLTGDASGSASFDGSANISIPVTIANDSHTHATSASSNATTNLTITAGGTTATVADLYATYADQLRTARTISLTGDVTGSTSFNGTGNVSIAATVANNSHTHTFANISDKPLSGGWSQNNNNNITTAQFLDLLEDAGAFKYGWFHARGLWSYAVTSNITDTGYGTLDLAGCAITVWGSSKNNCTVLVIPPLNSAVSSSVELGTIYIYVNNGEDYLSGWRKIARFEDINWNNITNKPSSFTPSSHTHPLSQISNLNAGWDSLLANAPSAYLTRWPSISEVTGKQNLVIRLNGGTTEGTNQFTYNGTTAKTLSITPSSIGAAASSHSHSYLPLSGGTMTGNIVFSGATNATSSIKMSTETSNYRVGVQWESKNEGKKLGEIGYWNTEQRIYLNALADEVSEIWTDTVGKYSLVVGKNLLTYNTHPLLHSANYTNYTVTKTGGGASGTWPISISGNAASANSATISNRATYLTSTYTGSGGLQPPSYFNGMGLKVNMMNKPVSYCDVIVVNGYGGQGSDVPYINALAFQKTANAHGEVYHARGDYNGDAWGTWWKFLDEYNYTGYTVTKTGGGASGTWNINISGTAASANSVAWNNVSGKPSSFTPSSHTHSISQVTGRGKLTFTGAATGTYDGSGNLTINIPTGGGEADSVAWNNITGKPSTFTPAAHTHGSDDVTALTGYSEGSSTTTLSASMSLNAALASLQNQIQTKQVAGSYASASHTHTASQVSGLARVATTGSYNDLTNKPTIPSIPSISISTSGSGNVVTGISATGHTITVTKGTISSVDTKNTTGTSNSNNKLYLVGGISQSNTGIVTYSNSLVYTQSGQLYASQMNATNGFFETSDARLKDFKENVKALDTVDQIPTKYFTWKEDESKESQIGTSAQEVEKLYPELVFKTEDNTLTVDYAKLSIIALAAIKELKAEIQSLKEEIKQLKSK